MNEQRKTILSAIFGGVIVLGALLASAWSAYIGMRLAASEAATE